MGGRPGKARCAAPTPTSTCKRKKPQASQAHPAALLQRSQQRARGKGQPLTEMRLQRPALQCPPPCCWPGSPCSHGGTPRPTHEYLVDGGAAAVLGGAAPQPQRVPIGQGSWAQTGRPCWLWARRTSQAGARDARQRQSPTPLKAEPNPRAGRAPGRGVGWLHTGSGLWRPPTYRSLRRRWLRVAACQPRGRAPEPHTGPTRAPPPPQPVRAPAAPTHWAGPRPPGPFKPGPYHLAGRGHPGRAGPPGARAEAAPAPGPRGAQGAARDPRSRLGSRPASGPPSHNGRVRGTRLSPSSPPAASGNPGTRARPRHTPSGPARSCAGAHRPRPARTLRSVSWDTCCQCAAASVSTHQARTSGGRCGPCSGHSRRRGP